MFRAERFEDLFCRKVEDSYRSASPFWLPRGTPATRVGQHVGRPRDYGRALWAPRIQHNPPLRARRRP